MSSTQENTPEIDTEPLPEATRRPPARTQRPEPPKPAGRLALEQALMAAGKELKDLT
ncbi:hypothetical protein ABGB18_31095 [Nonomuraea sp. B12E4]|uniref:hypothetical protein n=1 Tax=Nonomuraea sp. B12E4 TaxID=3153564 RepID=UPI00325D206A